MFEKFLLYFCFFLFLSSCISKTNNAQTAHFSEIRTIFHSKSSSDGSLKSDEINNLKKNQVARRDSHSGECGTSCTWTLDDTGMLTISGTGEMTNYSDSGGPWVSYTESILSVEIKSGITSIGFRF